MIPAASEAWDVKLGRQPKLAAHRQREAIKRRAAGAPVRCAQRCGRSRSFRMLLEYDPKKLQTFWIKSCDKTKR